MTRAVAVLVVVLAALAAFAACGPDNYTACYAYADTLNARRVDCQLPEIDRDAQCPPSVLHGADCTDFYDQLRLSVRCDQTTNTIYYQDDPYPYLAGQGCY